MWQVAAAEPRLRQSVTDTDLRLLPKTFEPQGQPYSPFEDLQVRIVNK